MSDPRFDVPVPKNYAILGEKVQLPFSGRDAPSRFMKGAMTERLSSWDTKDISKRGIPSQGLIKVYEEWGKGGYGIVLSGNTLVSQTSLEAAGNATISKHFDTPERAAAYEALIKGAKAHGSLYITQLSHAGRQVASIINDKPVSASDVKLEDRMGMQFAKPRPLTKDEIKGVIDDFAYAAKYIYDRGGDGVQLHAAHGYLLSQFLAKTTNKRTDEYGGDLHNRARIIYEIFRAIKEKVKDNRFILAIKINSVEFQSGNFSTEECREVCRELEKLGVDVIELSGGTYESLAFGHKKESTKAREAFFLEFADIIRAGLSKENGSTVWVTGGFRTAQGMVDAIESGSTQGIGLARPATDEFDLPNKLIRGEVPSSRKGLLDENDFGITNLASGVQMKQVSEGKQPFNITDAKQVEDFHASVKKYFEIFQAALKSGDIHPGFPDYTVYT